MRMPTLLGVALGAFVLGGSSAPAQVGTLPDREPALPHAKHAAPAAPCGPACAPEPGFKVLWVERQVPIQTLVPREVVTLVPTTTVEIAYREEKRVVTEMVLKPREVERPITSSILKPVTVTCPTTGECRTVLEPCVEVKMVKQTEFVAVPERRELVVKVPYLRTVEAQIPQKTLILEYKTELRKVGGAVKVPSGPEVLPQRALLAPKPPCEAAGADRPSEQPAGREKPAADGP